MQQIASEALEQLPLKPSPTANAGTRSACLAIPLKRGRVGREDFLYIDVIARLPQRPKEPDHGFVEEDVIRLVHVYVFKRVRTRICGQGFPLEALLHELTDASLRDRIIARTTAMMEALNPDEDFFDEANWRLNASGCGVLYWQH